MARSSRVGVASRVGNPVQRLPTAYGLQARFFRYDGKITKQTSASGTNPTDTAASASPLSTITDQEELDAYLTRVFHPPNVDQAKLKQLLHLMIAIREDDPDNLRPFFFDALLGGPVSEDLVKDLGAVITTDNGSFYHSWEFLDPRIEPFLLDPARSGDLYQPIFDTQIGIFLTYARDYNRWAKGHPGDVENLTDVYSHARNYFFVGLQRILRDMKKVEDIPEELWAFDPRLVWDASFVMGSYMFIGEPERCRQILHGRFVSLHRLIRDTVQEVC